jgi:hypothetical protein
MRGSFSSLNSDSHPLQDPLVITKQVAERTIRHAGDSNATLEQQEGDCAEIEFYSCEQEMCGSTTPERNSCIRNWKWLLTGTGDVLIVIFLFANIYSQLSNTKFCDKTKAQCIEQVLDKATTILFAFVCSRAWFVCSRAWFGNNRLFAWFGNDVLRYFHSNSAMMRSPCRSYVDSQLCEWHAWPTLIFQIVAAAMLVVFYGCLSVFRFKKKIDSFNTIDHLTQSCSGLFVLPTVLWCWDFCHRFKEKSTRVQTAVSDRNAKELRTAIGDAKDFTQTSKLTLRSLNLLAFLWMVNYASSSMIFFRCYPRCGEGAVKAQVLNGCIFLCWFVLVLVVDFHAAYCSDAMRNKMRGSALESVEKMDSDLEGGTPAAHMRLRFNFLCSNYPAPTIDVVLFQLETASLLRIAGTTAGLLYSFISFSVRT